MEHTFVELWLMYLIVGSFVSYVSDLIVAFGLNC